MMKSAAATAAAANTAATATNTKRLASLRIVGKDQRGVVATTTNVLNKHGCSVVQSEHYTDLKYNYYHPSCGQNHNDGTFVSRILFDYSNLTTSDNTRQSVAKDLKQALVDSPYHMESNLDWRHERKRIGIMVTKLDHCLWELLLRKEAKDMDCTIPIIIGNHPDLKPVADVFNVPFEVIPTTGNNKQHAEQQQLELFQQHNVDLIVLARYMQVLSDDFLNEYPNRIINIHHSFLPAFAGGRAYHQAHARGVKLIGATVKLL